MLEYIQYNIDSLKNQTIGEGGQSKLIVRICVYVLALTVFATCLLPSPYIIETPGPTLDVLGKSNDCEVIPTKTELAEEGQPTSEQKTVESDNASKGKILLLTVSVSGGIVSYSTFLNTIFALFKPEMDVIPNEAVYPPNTSSEQASNDTEKQMKGSQSVALTAANTILEKNNAPKIISDIPVCANNIGGPSGGTAFTLGMLEKLGGLGLTKGRIIAVTGTVDSDGRVGKIGGIKEKMISAYNDGARILLAPKANVDELYNKTKIPDDLKVIGIETIEDAVDALLN